MSAFGGAFGQPSSAFAAPSNSAFGAPSTFGQSSQSAFGMSTFGAPSGGLFGASAQQQQNSAFGSFGQSSAPFGASPAQSAPAFGASGAFGSSVFGSQPASGFGNTGVFGSSQSTFGSGGGVFGGSAGGGSSLFGNIANSGGAFGSSGSAFGQSQSAWGASSSSVFGGSSAFGASGSGGIFGNNSASPSLFGNQNNSTFGGAAPAQKGTAGIQWQITTEYDNGNPSAASKYHSITMMPAFREKSLEELRFEDYAMGNKGGSSPSSGNTLFGQSAPSTGLFASTASGSAFGSTGGGFGASASGFGQQSGAFGASSGGGLFGGNSLFGSTGGAFGQSSSGAFGNAGGGFGQSGGGLFGQPSGGGFGAQSSSGFGGASNAFGSSGAGSASTPFGSGGGSFGSGGTGFGTGNSGFGSGGSGFGGGGGFGTTGFGNSGLGSFGFGGNSQSGNNTLFGQSNAKSVFGAPQSQPTPFGAPAQTGSGLFGSSAPTGGNVFGGGQTTSNIFGGGGQQNNIFGGSASPAPPLFGSNNTGVGPSSAPSAPSIGFGAPSANAGLFGNPGASFGQSASGTGFGFGSTFGAQPNQPNAQPPLIGNPGGQVAPNAANLAQNPSVVSTLSAVMQGNGGTVAPPGANYGTVLHNLQIIKGELEQQKRLTEQQAKANAQNAHQTESVSVVVLPSPPLVRLSASRVGSDNGWTNRTQRTKMRSVVGKLGGATSKISGTPLKSFGAATQPETGALSTPLTSSRTVRKMPFFSPQQFTGSKRRPLRSSEIATPHRSTKTPLPVPDTISKAFRLKPGSGAERTSSRTKSLTGSTPGDGSGDNTSGGENRPNSLETALRKGAFANGSEDSSVRDRVDSADYEGEHKKGGAEAEEFKERRHSGINSTDEEFMWSSKRPSTWSLKRPVNSVAQFDPSEYLPFQTRDGFYTVPRLSELAAMTMKELQAVEGFTVGRDGYGEIRWIEPVDVRGLDLDNVVDIQRGEVAVYPERDAYQLDSPAEVTLVGMYKKEKRTGKPTVNKQEISKYASRLEAFCEKNDLRFIEYNPESGHWKFEVKTFARN